jgi:hypothetical protein
MSSIYVIQNQHGQYLDKHREWSDGSDRRILYRSERKDDAINTVFELSSKDIELRAHYQECETDDNGHPLVTVAEPSATAEDEAEDKDDSAQPLETSHG